MNALSLEAKSDNHAVLFPTHLVMRNNEIVGYGSINATPMINVWLHSKKVKPRDTLSLLNFAENMASCNGIRHIVVPCSKESPLFPFMEPMGFKNIGFTSLNLKKL